MYISSQVKSALRKFSEGKDNDCDSFMSDVSVLYQSSRRVARNFDKGGKQQQPILNIKIFNAPWF